MKHNTTHKGFGVPVAILIAGLLIAGAVFFSGGEGNTATAPNTGNQQQQVSGDFRMPDKSDHIRGNTDASIAIVEFSDLECPFCARLHPTLERIVAENEDVKWIYRHFPLTTIHSSALSAAVASECVSRLGTNDNFWSFVGLAFENQRQLGDSWYKQTASSFGIDAEAFAQCQNDKSVVSDIQEDQQEATEVGGRGTPYVVVVTPNGNLIPFSGALPYAQVINVINQARNN